VIQVVTDRDRGWAMWPFYFIPSWCVGTPREAAYVEHEKVHCRRQRWITPIWFILWRLSRRFRWQEESLAYQKEIEVLIKGGNRIDMEYYATTLSDDYYNLITYENAFAWLQQIVE
jgi:hypothetical protein